MAVRKICKQKGCRASPRCGHPWWFDVMHGGKRWRMPVDDFALARGAKEPIVSKQTAERVWAPKFLARDHGGTRSARTADDTAGRGRPDRRRIPRPLLRELRGGGRLRRSGDDQGSAQGGEGRRSAICRSPPWRRPSEILRFRAAYRQGHKIATVNRALSTLRAAINWGRFQDPPVLCTSPFHRFGVSIKTKEETKRDRRIGSQEEQRLLARSWRDELS